MTRPTMICPDCGATLEEEGMGTRYFWCDRCMEMIRSEPGPREITEPPVDDA